MCLSKSATVLLEEPHAWQRAAFLVGWLNRLIFVPVVQGVTISLTMNLQSYLVIIIKMQSNQMYQPSESYL